MQWSPVGVEARAAGGLVAFGAVDGDGEFAFAFEQFGRGKGVEVAVVELAPVAGHRTSPGGCGGGVAVRV